MAASAAMQPLSAHERAALVRILGASAQETHRLQPRQKAALDAYLFVLSRPPLDPREVLNVARALIRTWLEVDEAKPRPQPRKPSERRIGAISAVLLDPPVSTTAGTETMSPLALSAVLESYGYR